MSSGYYPAAMGRTEDLAAVDTALTRIGREATSRRAQRLRAERSRVDISALGVSVLAAIYRNGPLTLRNVADLVDTQPSRVSKEVTVLRERGYVSQLTHPSDARAYLLSVSARGRHAFERYRRAADDMLADRLDGWSNAQLHALATLLTRLAEDTTGVRDVEESR
jgi:DNA-binding MarR family transcriptional regulator